MAGPTTQAIEYEIGFIDSATGGMRQVQTNFDATVDAMDGMVDNLGKAADMASENSDKYNEAVKSMASGGAGDAIQQFEEGVTAPSLKDELADNLGDAVHSFEESMAEPHLLDEFSDSLEGASTKFIDDMSDGMGDLEMGDSKGKDGFFGGLKKIFPMLGKALKMFVRYIPTIGAVAAAFRALAPLFEMIGFFVDILLMPFEELFVNIGMQLIPIVNDLANLFYGMIDDILPAIIRTMKDVANVIIKDVIPAIRDFTFKYIVPTVKWVAELISTFVKWKGAIYVVGGVLSALLLPALVSVIGAVWSFTIALLANPITWVVALIAGLVVGLIYLYNHFEGVRDVVKAVWGTVKVFFETLFGWFKTLYDWIGSKLSKWLDIGGADRKGRAFARDFASGMEKAGVSFEGPAIAGVRGMGKAVDTSIVAEEARVGMSTAIKEGASAGARAEFSAIERGKMKPLPAFESGDAGKEVADPIIRELRVGFESVVNTLESRESDHIDISQEIRTLGMFAG